MSSGSFKQVDVLCPYYITDNGRDRIVCEGLTVGGQTQSFYRHRRDYAVQMEICSSWSYWRCPICDALDGKHRED